MIIELGHYALILAVMTTFVQCVFPLWGAIRQDPWLQSMARISAFVTFALVVLSYAALTYAYLSSDFSVANVVLNSHSTKPLIYKISGVWSNHEGSMMLWVLILVFFAALVAFRSDGMPERLLASVLSVQGAIAFAFLIFIVLTSNPFLRVGDPPADGQGLNPILADPGLAIHPPLLYLGYVGFSVAFSFAIGALIHGRIDAIWARFVRPWTLLAWIFLTLGISMGSYWAYYELGWGGWWFWDPVENASLMPWLMGTALLHSTIVMEKRDALKVWTILLSILTFSLSLLGTFLVRSGVITSVHSFASDPGRGLFILGILVVFIGGGLLLFALRASSLKQGGLFAPVSREGALVLNNLFLAASTVAVLVGTLYPLVLETFSGAKISVGAPYFNLTAVPLFIILLVLVPFGQSLAWKRGDLLGVMQRLLFAFGFSILAALIIFAFTTGGPVMAPVGIGLGLWMILGSATDIFIRIWPRRFDISHIFARAWGLPRSAWGTALAHAGLGISVIGIAATAWGVEHISLTKAGEKIIVGPYNVALETSFKRSGQGFREEGARFLITRDDQSLGALETSKRVHAGREMPTTEAGIETFGFGQLYASLNEILPDGRVSVHLYWKPLVTLIWGGSLLMALGGALSLSDRRVRITAAERVSRATGKSRGAPA
ncbi:MAG: heme lyase CcmF/NrfE family subunit [Hyphomicrobiales bacterium]|nr:heme lyase CcmF/NrfE family subunit [Hyphomicrobiales bacterium]